MNILPVKNNYNIYFKNWRDDGIIGFDDSVSQRRREAIRAHYNSWHMPYQSIYECEQHLNNSQMSLFLKNLEKHHKMQHIEGTSIYRGQTLVDKPSDLYNLKTYGIKRVIDLVGYGKEYEKAVKNAGLEYYTYNIFDNWWNVNEINQEHIEKLVEFIKEMQKGNIYIGCQHGSNDTDIAFILNNFFNPNFEEKEVKTKIQPSDSDFSIKLNTIYDMFTKSHKNKLGWTKDFEQKLIKKLISI